MLEEISSLKTRINELESIQRELENSPHNSYCLNDPDAHLMKSRDGFIPAYNLQVGTDAENKMIVLSEITDSTNDINELEKNYNQLQEQIGIIPETILADTGYGNLGQIEHIESSSKTQCVIAIEQSPAKKKDQENGVHFTYDSKVDMYICCKGKKLKRKNRIVTHGDTTYNVYQAKGNDCRHCSLWNKCTSAKNGRAIKIPQNQEFRKEYTSRLELPKIKELIKERKNLIEHVFGTLKRWMGKVPLLLTSKEKVQIEIDLYATAYNFKRLLNIESVPVLIQKLKNTCILKEINSFLLSKKRFGWKNTPKQVLFSICF